MNKTLVIAEAGVNHDGDVSKAKALVDVAARAGADIVKFQTFRADALVTRDAPKAEYQKRTSGSSESQYDMLKRLELRPEDYAELKSYSEERGLEFLSTPFDKSSAELLTDLGVQRFKVGSGDLTNAPLLLQLAKTGRSIILSTGMASLGEIEEALGVVAFGYGKTGEPPSRAAFKRAWAEPEMRRELSTRMLILHCTTEYPCPPEDANLGVLKTLMASFSLPVGFSDHCEGPAVSVAAVALGATAIEKHITLDRQSFGPDHEASMEPDEFAEMVRQIRTVERARGDGVKVARPSEVHNISVARKSLHVAREISAGSTIGPEDLICIRPGNGRPPIEYWELVGSEAGAAYKAGDPI